MVKDTRSSLLLSISELYTPCFTLGFTGAPCPDYSETSIPCLTI